MWIQQMFVALLCMFVTLQRTNAVVNSGQSLHNTAEDTSSNADNAASVAVNDNNAIADSVASATSDQEANRRDAALTGLLDTYGPPVVPHETYGPPVDNSYIPPAPSNHGLPVPVYGVPDGPNNNVVYPGPPPDIPPGLPSLHASFNSPHDTYGPPKQIYGPPKEIYGPPKDLYGPPPKDNYGPPPLKYGPPRPIKPFHPPPHFHKPPRHHYGPPRPQYGPPPKLHFGGPKLPKPQYGPPFKSFHGPQKPIYGPPKPIYGPPKLHGPPPPPPPSFYGPPPQDNYGPPIQHGPPPHIHHHYGPPDPVPHGPPHPGAPAPPTPPDIKYDGWQPIPGLVSRPPSDSYGVPHGQPYSLGDLHFNGDFVPPPAEHQEHGVQSLSLGTSYGSSAGISDSYGAPLNTVTGSGGIVSTSGDAHINSQDQNAISLGLSAAGIEAGHDNSLSVIKSIGYEIHPNVGFDVFSGGVGNHIGGPSDTYGAPTINSYSLGNAHFVSSGNSYKPFSKGMSLSTNGIGLIPPSGFYGAVPSGHYGTPLLTPPSPPKRPIAFRDQISGPSYIPQQISDGEIPHDEPPSLTNFYTLPNTNNPTSFQNIDHGLSFGGAQAQALTSYNVPLNTVDNMYGIPGGVGIDHSLPGSHIDLTHINVGNSLGSATYAVPQFNVPHDCSMYKSQPLPQLSYGVPSASSYTASLSSLHTNIGGTSPSGLYGTPDLQTAHSQVTNGAVPNEIIDDNTKAMHGKALAENFAPGSELIQSHSIDFNNIPIQGNLGSYTLQIQSADGLGSTGQAMHVQHDQVLNDGLLQSILAAIEQPQQKNAQILGQPLLQLQPSANELTGYSKDDDEAQNSVKNPVIVAAPTERASDIGSADVEQNENDNDQADTTDSLQLIDNNEIALYFSNKIGTKATKMKAEIDNNNSKDTMDLDDSGDPENGSWNGQQFSSYVAFKTPSSSYMFGDRKMSSDGQASSSVAVEDSASSASAPGMASAMDDSDKSDTTTPAER